MSNLLKISQQTLWQVAGKIVTSLSTFIILGLVARSYGEEGTGIFTLALTYLAIFYLLADFGFNAHELKRIKNQESRIKDLEFRRLLGTRIIWSALLVILATATLPLWPFGSPLFSQAVLFGALAIIFSAVYTTCNLIFQSKLRYDLSVLASGTGTLLSLLVFIYLISLKIPISFMLLVHLFGWIMIAMIALWLAKGGFPVYSIPYTLKLFKSSWPIAATLAVNVVYFRADSFMIAYFKGVADVGVYNVAYQVFQSVLVLPTFIMNAYYPLMLKSLKEIKLVALGLFGLAGFGSLATLILAPLIIKILTGSGFAGSTPSLQILSLGFPAYFLSSLLMWILVTRGQYKVMLLVYAIGLIFNLTANFRFIPAYSFIAASWITVISEYLILLMQIMVLWRKR